MPPSTRNVLAVMKEARVLHNLSGGVQRKRVKELRHVTVSYDDS
jgi:hypothetical protein